jgi:hypothetical protein
LVRWQIFKNGPSMVVWGPDCEYVEVMPVPDHVEAEAREDLATEAVYGAMVRAYGAAAGEESRAQARVLARYAIRALEDR